MPLKVSRHPLVADSLVGLRDRATEPEEFRELARKVITLLLYEATADLPVRHGTVQTPLKEAPATFVEREVVAIPVLRAGLGILGPALELLPRVSVGYIGLERDEASLHNWVLANQRMAAALKAKGYHYRFVFSKASRHCDRKVKDQTLPEALAWLWNGYPVK